MSSIDLSISNKARLDNLGLLKLTANKYYDPETKAEYTFSSRGYVFRTTPAGMYQVNPRFKVKGNGRGTKQVSATVRTNDAGALTEIAVRSVKSYRKYAGR